MNDSSPENRRRAAGWLNMLRTDKKPTSGIVRVVSNMMALGSFATRHEKDRKSYNIAVKLIENLKKRKRL